MSTVWYRQSGARLVDFGGQTGAGMTESVFTCSILVQMSCEDNMLIVVTHLSVISTFFQRGGHNFPFHHSLF